MGTRDRHLLFLLTHRGSHAEPLHFLKLFRYYFNMVTLSDDRQINVPFLYIIKSTPLAYQQKISDSYNMKTIIKNIISNLPQGSGVYLFKDAQGEILYIGKAKNIRTRVRSHFRDSKDKHWANFYNQVTDIDTITTPTEKDALVLESEMVKKYQPKYNVELKDDKGFFYVTFSNDVYPKVALTHFPKKSLVPKGSIGPFVSGKEIKQLLRMTRKLFPYRTCNNSPEKPCLYHDIGLCTAHGTQAKYYPHILQGLKAILCLCAGNKPRIETYDISNTQGSLSVGSMVVFSGDTPKKSDYRKFKIKTVKGSNDPASLKEVFIRRLQHNEWASPDLVVVDGGKSQLSRLKKLPVPIITLAKRATLKKRSATDGTLYSQYGSIGVPLSSFPKELQRTLLRGRDEAHRFAITYHRNRQIKELSQ